MLTQDLLNEIFKYDPETGVLERRTASPYSRERGVAKEYPQVSINGKQHRTHRVIWLMVYGNIPKGKVIDHVNGDTTDTRLCNLRLATQGENVRNKALESKNTSGFKGVCPHQKSYTAQLTINGVKKHLGCFTNVEEAARAYDQAAIKHFGEFARTNSMMGLLPNTSANV